MERKWTDAQILAMDTTDKTLLVSAAAGSGKTATLTERIIRRIIDPDLRADISKMLIVTFTRSAAAELRSRIFSALGEALAKNPRDTHLTSQLMKVGSAKICTIDAFYLDIVKANFSSLGMSASFRIADVSEYDILSRRVMNECVSALYDSNPAFPRFVECFTSVRYSGKIIDVLLDLYSDLSSFPDGIEYVKKCAERTEAEASLDFFATSYGAIQRKNASDVFEHYYNVLKSSLEYMLTDEHMTKAYFVAFKNDFDYCERLRAAVIDERNGYNDTRALLASYSAISLGRLLSKNATPEAVKYRVMRTAYTKKLPSLYTKSFSKPQKTISRAMRDTAENLYILYEILSLFEKNITEEKKRLSICTFDDVSIATRRLLVNPDETPTEIAKQYASQFTDIYIDEYQDVDMIQDSIFRAISTPTNRFMVGDIKQSIYSFRGAEPQLFSNYRRDFPAIGSSEADRSDCATIFMSNNFRCDSNVIKFTNEVCSMIFSACADSIGYTEKDDLVFSKDNGIKDYVSPPVKIAIITPPEESEENDSSTDELRGAEREAEYIAAEIARLISEEKKADGTPILPGDIAVLFRAKKFSPIMADALRKRGILSAEADGARYFEDPDVLMMLCILNCIDNPQRDIYLAGALRSPIFNFTMDELIRIRNSSDESFSLFGALQAYAEQDGDALANKCRSFLQTLDAWQKDAASLAVDRFIRTLYESDRFIASGLISQTNGKGEGGNLLMLYEYARSFESGSFKGLYQFIEYINSVIENGGALPTDGNGASPDRVSLMTVHKSKGLEFPVCFIANTAASVRSRDSRDSLVFEYPSGIAMKIADGSGLAQVNTPMREAILAVTSNKKMEEEMRVLYVALTRARERLYLVASATANAATLFNRASANAAFPDRYTIMQNCLSYLDWVFLAMEGKNSSSYELEMISISDIDAAAHGSAEKTAEETLENLQLTERLREEFKFKYKYGALCRVPSKLSVSKLYPDVLDESDTSAPLFDEKPQKTQIPEFFSGVAKKVSAAERGTATHLFLQFCDFGRVCESGVGEELSRLLQKRFLPSNAPELIYRDELDAFAKSELMRLILDSKEIIREQRFNVELAADGFTSDESLLALMGEDRLAVQGVIDLIILNADGSISLFDYKTDRLSAAELEDGALAAKRMNDAHGLQLSYYAKAVELLFGRKCSRVCVYSTHSARLYEITSQF